MLEGKAKGWVECNCPRAVLSYLPHNPPTVKPPLLLFVALLLCVVCVLSDVSCARDACV